MIRKRRRSMNRGALFKAGLLVEDLEAAMRDIGNWLALTWTPIQESPLLLETNHGREAVDLRYVYSKEGPMHLELIEAHTDGFYATAGGSNLHHVGRWVDDLSRASAELAANGLPLEAAGVDGAGRSPAIFAFHGGGQGLRVELLDRAMQPTFEGWLAGGTLDLG